MTTDKIKHYIGEGLFNHIGSLNNLQLISMKADLIQDMELLKDIRTVTYFHRNIELELINKRLGL